MSLPPEILRQIFDLDHLQFGDQVTIARVCKAWVPNIEVLFRLLAPFMIKDGKLVFARSLSAEDWERFNYHACRVHDLNQIGWPLHPCALLTALSDYCPNLEHLMFHTTLIQRTPADQCYCPTYDELKPLTRLSGLQPPFLQHTKPFQLAPEDFITIVRALPSLTGLNFNTMPDITTALTLNISILSMLRDLCPILRSLGLYLDAREHYILPPPSGEGDDVQGRDRRPPLRHRTCAVFFCSLAT